MSDKKDELPYLCPEHPRAQIRHEFNRDVYTIRGGQGPGVPIDYGHRYFCAICNRELASEKPKEEE